MAGAIMPKFISDEEMMKLEDQKGFLSDEQMTALESSGPSALEAGIQGAFEGASLGWRDELAGALEAGGQFLGVKGLGGKFSDIELQDSISADQLGKVYEETKQRRESELSKYKEAQPEAFLAGNVAGGLASSFAVPNPATLGGRIALGAGTGAVAGAGQAEEGKALQGAALGGLIGGAVVPAAEGVGKLLSAGAQKAGGKLMRGAEFLQESAIGGTPTQRELLKPGTGRYVLENLSKPFQSADDLFKAAQSKASDTGKIIGDTIEQLDAQGIKVSQDTIISNLESKIAALADNPSTEAVEVSNKLQKIVDSIYERGSSNILPSKAMEIKQGFKTKPSDWLDPSKAIANKNALGAYSSEIEKNVPQLGEDVLSQFQAAKKEYGFLKPILAASENKAMKEAMAPPIGYRNLPEVIVGSQVGGLPGTVASTVASKILGPRTGSTVAHTTDMIGKLLKAAPEKLGKYHRILNNSAERGINSVAITDYLLSQQDPEYREMKRQLDENR